MTGNAQLAQAIVDGWQRVQRRQLDALRDGIAETIGVRLETVVCDDHDRGYAEGFLAGIEAAREVLG